MVYYLKVNLLKIIPVAKTQTPAARIALAFAAIYIIWGTTYLAVRIGIETIPPFMMGAVRYSIAGLLFLSYSLLKKERLSWRMIVRNIILGIIMQTGGQAMLFWCEKYISSGLTAILVAAEPIWFILLDKLNWNFYFKSRLMLGGIAAGFVGIVVLFENLLKEPTIPGIDTSMQLIAAIVTLLSGVIWAGGSLYFARRKREGSLYVNLGWQLAGGVISCSLVSALSKEYVGFAVQQVSAISMAAVLYLAIAGSIAAFAAYNWLLTKKPGAVVGTYAYINPVIAVIAGCLLAGEPLFINQFAGMIIILISAYLVNKAGAGIQEVIKEKPPHVEADKVIETAVT